MAISSALGDALVPTSYGFRNKIINGNFMINQRGYTSASNLASGSYGFDRWKSMYTNTTLTFTSAPQGQTVTISASGVIRQIVERANVPAGTYVLSWSGSATGRVYNSGASAPSYASGPVSVYLDGTADVIVEFTPASGTATLGNVQLEFGTRATPFEFRPIGVELLLCQRYFEKSYDYATAAGTATDSGARYGVANQGTGLSTGKMELGVYFQVRKRGTPSIVLYDRAGNINKVSVDDAGVNAYNNQSSVAEVINQSGFRMGRSSGGTNANMLIGHFLADAEL